MFCTCERLIFRILDILKKILKGKYGFEFLINKITMRANKFEFILGYIPYNK